MLSGCSLPWIVRGFELFFGWRVDDMLRLKAVTASDVVVRNMS